MCKYLDSLYIKYNIDNLPYGNQSDALGDLYEEYVEYIFSNEYIVKNFNAGIAPSNTAETLFYEVCGQHDIEHIDSIARLSVPKRESGGEPKTDFCVQLNDEILKFSVKQSHAAAITVAEFDVNTISEEVGITDERLVSLMRKFQKDGSGKNFQTHEKVDLTERLRPYKKNFVRWAISGTATNNSDDLRMANHTIMFMVDKNNKRLNDFSTYTISEQVSKITNRQSGYGTGLSWTYATGTKGKKIQFKCPVM